MLSVYSASPFVTLLSCPTSNGGFLFRVITYINLESSEASGASSSSSSTKLRMTA